MKVLIGLLLVAVVCVYGTTTAEVNRYYDLSAGATEDVYCKACQDIMKDLRMILNYNKTQALVENFLDDQLCSRLGQSASLCKQYVNSYGPLLFKFIITELDSLKLCSKIKLCPAQQQVLNEPVAEIPMLRLLDPKPVTDDKSFAACFICKWVLKELYAEVGKEATEAEIEAYLEKVCNIIPSRFRSECVSLIDKYTPTIVKLVLKKLPPEQICKEIGLCSSLPNTANLFYISPVN